MVKSTVIVSRLVRRYLKENKTSQARLAQCIGLTQSQLSARLRGATRWTVDELDLLAMAGVELPRPAEYGEALT